MAGSDDDEFDGPVMKMSAADRRKLLSRARAILKATAKKRTLWDVVDEYTLEALVELRLVLMTGGPRAKFQAADRLATIWTRLPPRPALPPEAGVVPGSDEWKQRCRDAEQDAAVRAWLVEQGWTPPTPSREKN